MKTVFDMCHVKSVSAHVLLNDAGEIRGKIIANWGDSPNGSTCTAQVILWEDLESHGLIQPMRTVSLMGEPRELQAPLIGRAGGYGYDKWSSAVYEALRPALKNETEQPNMAGVGESAVRDWFSSRLNLRLERVI